MKMDFSPLCRGRLSTIFRRFTSLLGVGTRLTRIDKTSCSSSPVFSILAGRDSTSRVADKRCHWCKNQVEMGTFLQTNKQTRYRYIHSCQGKFPSFLSKAPVQGAPITLTGFGFGGENVARKKLLKILLKIVEICTCDDEIIVNVTLAENVQPCL